MNEKEPLAVIKFRDKDASFYWRRLVLSLQLKDAIDEGAYGPMRYYTGSESTLKGEQGAAAVNIWPENGVPGLRRGVLFSVYGSYRWLATHGYEEEVKTLIDHHRHPSV